uniref:TNFR-Cys domain-containing protein n=1 Tax=Pygocentrus nattereri TaxID=42514 RepID=A0A3B4DEE0_PYGNA
VCDPGQGLRVKTPCTRSSDTVCEPLDGYYCTDQHRGGCILAQKHTNCSPGQYINLRVDCCVSGQHVYKHCSGDSSTTCVQCSQSTYIDFPNNFISCISCTLCDEGIGLRTKQECQSSADTLCEPLLGYYCIETHGKNCRKARQHSTCLPGQYINKTGTAFTDTVCKDCSKGSYSDGSFTVCKPHRKCESEGQITTTPGTKSSDSECTDKRSHFLSLVAISLPALVMLGLALWVLYLSKKRIHRQENEIDLPSTPAQSDKDNHL